TSAPARWTLWGSAGRILRREPSSTVRRSSTDRGRRSSEGVEHARRGPWEGVPSDEALVLALSQGKTDSLGVLVSRWEQPLYRFVYRLLDRREDARDICQETSLRVLRKAHEFKTGSRFSTWMYQIALNLCRDQMRR